MEEFFSPSRMNPYLVRADYVEGLATDLYIWNTEISASLWKNLSHLEVALRNRISKQLEIRYLKLGLSEQWIFDPVGELSRGNRKTLEHLNRARSEVLRKGHELNEARVISELPFGFWHILITRRYRNLWPEIADGFPGLQSRNPDTLSFLVGELRTLRNHIGHHHSIIKLDLDKSERQILELSSLISPEFGDWMRKQSEVENLLLLKPSQTTQE